MEKDTHFMRTLPRNPSMSHHHCCLLTPFFNLMQAEVVDKLPEIRKECLLQCPKQEELYQACVTRITEKKEGDCESWFMEFIHCQDKCVAPKIFAVTKER
jgi:hypothetical protein